MKKTLMKSLALAFVGSLFVAGSAMAIPTPWLDYSGDVTVVDLDNNGTYDFVDATLSDVHVSNVTYVDPIDSLINSGSDTILGEAVSLGDSLYLEMANYYPSSADTTFANSTLTIGAYFSADLVNINYRSNTATSGDINNTYTANLENIVIDNTIGSQWLNEFAATLVAPENLGAASVEVAFYGPLTSNLIPALQDSKFAQMNIGGKVAPVPEPATMLLLGTGLVGLAGARRRRKANK